MSGDKCRVEPEVEESEDDAEILEESPCGRWLKRAEKVDQRDVPGIDNAYLAMDTEEGVEVVWNEVQFSERKNYRIQEGKIRHVFENLTRLRHPNIVKFHRYWTDTHDDKPRVIFITEYMSSGTLKQFLKRTKHNAKRLPLQSWKKWCTQILSALNYLHSCCPPIVHGNLTCDTIFIQHNGLLKIGSVAPDTIHHHVKTCRDQMKIYFTAPEYGEKISPAVDIYSFGVCALQMAALEVHGNGESGSMVNEEDLRTTVETLEDKTQKEFILECLSSDPDSRPTARELLLHPALFEVHSLKLLAAHTVVHLANGSVSEIVMEAVQKYTDDTVYAVIPHSDPNKEGEELKIGDIQLREKLEKFVDDVSIGIYPLTVCKLKEPPCPSPRPSSPDLTESAKSSTPEPVEFEERRILNMMCSIKPKDNGSGLIMIILLRLEDKMNRQLSCHITPQDSGMTLADELVYYGFINEKDRDQVSVLIDEALHGRLKDDPEENTYYLEVDPSEQTAAETLLGPTNFSYAVEASPGPTSSSDASVGPTSPSGSAEASLERPVSSGAAEASVLPTSSLCAAATPVGPTSSLDAAATPLGPTSSSDAAAAQLGPLSCSECTGKASSDTSKSPGSSVEVLVEDEKIIPPDSE